MCPTSVITEPRSRIRLFITRLLTAFAITSLNLTSLAKIIPDNLKQIIAKAELGESGGLEFPGAVDAAEANKLRDALYAWFRLSRQDVLLNYSTLISNHKEQNIWIEIGEMLPPDEYLDYLNQMLDGFAGGRIPLEAVETAFLGRSQKDGFLPYNYDTPSVQSLYTKAMSIIPPTSQIMAVLKDGKDGKLKKSAIMNREMSRRPLPDRVDAGTSTQSINTPTATPQPSIVAQVKPPETKPIASTPTVEPTSSTPWSVIVVLIVAAMGLLWLLLKRRS